MINKIITLALALAIISCSTSNQETTDTENITNAQVQIGQNLNNVYRSPLYLSADYGASWEDVSQGLPTDIQVSFLEELDGEIVMATDNYGVLLSEDKRSNWQQIGDALPNKKVVALHIADSTIFISAYRQGIYASPDKGATWNTLNYNLADLAVQSILFADGQLLAGTDSGIFQFNNQAKSWIKLFDGPQTLSLNAYDGRLVAGTSQGTLLSTNQGKDWAWIHQEGAVHYTHMLGNRIVEMYITGELYISDDWGDTWVAAAYTPNYGSYVYEVAALHDKLVLSNNYGIHQSTDGGKTWQHIFPTEAMGFFDFLVLDGVIYGGTRQWDEYRKKSDKF